MEKINGYIDHTNLKADAVEKDILKLCREALEYGFASVCINPCWVKTAYKELCGSGVKVCSVIGFPLGANDTAVKVFEAKTAVESGAEEIDMVINIGRLKEGNAQYVENEIAEVKKAIGGAVLKVIIECCVLTDDEKRAACSAAVNAGADFVKTSTGFGAGGAVFEDIKIMREAVGERAKIKAAGGIRDFKTAELMIKAGADRIGASAGIDIVKGSMN
ncbi:deoxyribose-phosphate aldolase [Anaerotignum faecicola]|nr:deoxyribose-phosphate aldolase [Anaerotignum faecicola]